MGWFTDELTKIRLAELRYERVILIIGLLLLTILMLSPNYMQQLSDFVSSTGDYGYLGAFIAGAVSSLGVTVPPAAAVMFVLGKTFPAWAVAAVGATGGTLADLVMFEVAKRRLAEMFRKEERKHPKLSIWMHRLAPMIIGFIIASPLPDELASGVVGAMRFNEKKFIIIVWVSHFLVMFVVASAGSWLI